MRKATKAATIGSRSSSTRDRNRRSVPAVASALLGAAAAVLLPAMAAAAAAEWLPIGPPVANASLSQVMPGPPAAGAESIYAVQFESSSGDFNGLWHSADGGVTWSGPMLVSGAVAPTLQLDGQPGVLYATTDADIFNVAPATVVSRDGGATWQALPLPPSPLAEIPLALAADPLEPGKFVELDCTVSDIIDNVSLCGSYSIFATNTGGRGFHLLGTLGGIENGSPAASVRLAPGNPGQAFAILGGGTLFKAAPGSLGLSLLPLRGPVDDVAVAPSTAGAVPTLYAAVSQNRTVWKSTDGGQQWVPASAGLPRSLHPLALALDLAHPSTLYLAAREGLFVSDDGAASWQALPTAGLPPVAVTSIAAGVATSNHTVFVATAGAGAFILSRP
jgi:hypothetical protein